MGPGIILDKSSLQSLSINELILLHKYYFIVLCPILIIEILGDLKKYTNKPHFSETQVSQLSKKLLQTDSVINEYYRKLIEMSLLGYHVEMSQRPIVGGGIPVKHKSGKKGIIFKESIERKAIGRWKSRKFTEAENILSERWRESTKSIDLENHKVRMKSILKYSPSFNTLNDLKQFLDDLLNDEKNQTELLKIMIYEFPLNYRIVQKIFLRWEKNDFNLIKDFSPYAYHCLSMNMFFYYGLVNDSIGTRSTNKIDLEYLYYLPFCNVFSSRDNFHKSITPLFLNTNQIFIDGDDLKLDLKSIWDSYNKLGVKEKVKWEIKYKSEPPKSINNATYEIWKNLFPYWIPGREYNPKKTSSNGNHNTVREMKNLFNSPLDKDALKSKEYKEDEIDFIMRESWISIDDPCPCKSGKKFRDCHWDENNK